MPRFKGKIGYAVQVETPENSGIFKNQIKTVVRRGTISKDVVNYQSGDSVNDNTKFSTTLNIVASEELMANYQSIIFVEHKKILWKVASVQAQYPELIITLGGVYNGKKPT